MATYQATTKASEAPTIADDMYDGKLVRVDSKRVKGGKYTQDTENGDLKLEWVFNLLDESGAVMTFGEDSKPVEVSKLTGVGFNIASKTVPQEVRMLKALLTKSEYASFEAGEGTPDDSEDKADGGLLGRKAQLEVFTKENGWPGVGNVIAPRGGQKG